MEGDLIYYFDCGELVDVILYFDKDGVLYGIELRGDNHVVEIWIIKQIIVKIYSNVVIHGYMDNNQLNSVLNALQRYVKSYCKLFSEGG